ncbi:hypothetical protein [Paenibacillus durus]|uniref:hypothetical protein n=1 Tax=Paenibacillus durus TaxID=44251 RepID=UPI000B249A7B|nr:hypothetical protein [Paenibacillus durus]
MKRTKRIVTVVYEYDSAEEAAQHRRIMEADEWIAHEISVTSVLTTMYTLELAEEDGV